MRPEPVYVAYKMTHCIKTDKYVAFCEVTITMLYFFSYLLQVTKDQENLL